MLINKQLTKDLTFLCSSPDYEYSSDETVSSFHFEQLHGK